MGLQLTGFSTITKFEKKLEIRSLFDDIFTIQIDTSIGICLDFPKAAVVARCRCSSDQVAQLYRQRTCGWPRHNLPIPGMPWQYLANECRMCSVTARAIFVQDSRSAFLGKWWRARSRVPPPRIKVSATIVMRLPSISKDGYRGAVAEVAVREISRAFLLICINRG